MAGMSDYSAQNWLNYISGSLAMPALPAVFLGLLTAALVGLAGAVIALFTIPGKEPASPRRRHRAHEATPLPRH